LSYYGDCLGSFVQLSRRSNLLLSLQLINHLKKTVIKALSSTVGLYNLLFMGYYYFIIHALLLFYMGDPLSQNKQHAIIKDYCEARGRIWGGGCVGSN